MKRQILFVLAVALIVCGYLIVATENAFSQEPSRLQCGPNGCHAVPQTVYVPRVQYQPYQYQGTAVRSAYAPVRRFFGFRVYRFVPMYAPVQQ